MSLLLSALALGSSLQAAVSGDSEVAVGSAPVGLGSVSEREQASSALRLQPAFALWQRSRARELRLSYSPRLFYRLPNLAGLDRPLLLQEAQLTYEANRPRYQVFASVEGTYGELDYTAVGDVFGTSQTGQVNVDIASIRRGFASTGLVARSGARTEWSATLAADYTTFSSAPPLTSEVSAPSDAANGSSSPTGTAAPEGLLEDAITDLPASLLVEAQLGLSHRVTRQDTLGLRNQVAYQWFEGQGAFLLVGPEMSWRHQLTPGSSFDVAVGLAYVRVLDVGPFSLASAQDPLATATTAPNSLAPVGGLEVALDIYSGGGLSVAWQGNASLEWVFDPLAGASVPRTGGETQLSLRVGRRWAVTPNAGFYTQLRDTPLQGGDIDARFDQTLLRAEVPLNYAPSPGLQLSVGGRATYRGPRVGAADFTLARRRELWAFFAVSASFPAEASEL